MRPPPDSPLDPIKQPASLGTTVLGWTAVQVAVLALASSRLKFWARFPEAGESLAPQVLLMAQLLVCCMMFPRVLSNLRQAIAIAVTGTVMLQFAGLLASTRTPLRSLMILWCCVSVLLAFTHLLRRGDLDAVGVCVACALFALACTVW